MPKKKKKKEGRVSKAYKYLTLKFKEIIHRYISYILKVSEKIIHKT